jgi:hypothetical protein
MAALAGLAAGAMSNPESGLHKLVHSVPIVGDIAGFFGFSRGGRVPKSGKYVAHAGEIVVPAATVRKYSKKKPTRVPTKVKAKGAKPHAKKKAWVPPKGWKNAKKKK